MPFELIIHDLQKENIVIQAVKITFYTEKGQHTILPGHEPFFTMLTPDQVTFVLIDHTEEAKPVTQGFLKFLGERCDVWLT